MSTPRKELGIDIGNTRTGSQRSATIEGSKFNVSLRNAYQ